MNHGPSPSREVLATRLRTPFPRSQALEQTAAGFTLYSETQEWGEGDFSKVTQTGVGGWPWTPGPRGKGRAASVYPRYGFHKPTQRSGK